jgi:hypothetical protein
MMKRYRERIEVLVPILYKLCVYVYEYLFGATKTPYHQQICFVHLGGVLRNFAVGSWFCFLLDSRQQWHRWYVGTLYVVRHVIQECA